MRTNPRTMIAGAALAPVTVATARCLAATWIIVAASLMSSRPASAREPSLPLTAIRVDSGRVSAHIEAAPLGTVMDELARLTGATVEWRAGRDEAPVSVQFSELSLGDAVTRVLGMRNHFLVVGRADGSARVRRIVIVSTPSPSRAFPTRLPASRDWTGPPSSEVARQVGAADDTPSTPPLADYDPVAHQQMLVAHTRAEAEIGTTAFEVLQPRRRSRVRKRDAARF